MTTRYTYDILQTYANVLTETANGETTAYEYGLERIAAYTGTDAEQIKTQYVYDVRGSVIQTVTARAYRELSEATAAPTVTVQGYAYTPYGEQIGSKVSGYGYNGEYYDAATDMLNLRARQYEPAQMRFSRPDIVRGYAVNPQSVNRYAYCVNNPVMYEDPSGKVAKSVMNNNVIMPVALGEEIVSGKLSKSVKNIVKGAKFSPYERAKSGYRDLNAKQQQVIDDAEEEIAELRKSGELTDEIEFLIKKAACREIEEYSEYEDAQDANGYPTNYGYNFDVNRNIDEFIDDVTEHGREDEINIPHYVVIDGVVIAPETYSPEELRRIVTRAKEKGKKIDWDDFDQKFTGREETSSWLDDVIEVISDATNDVGNIINDAILFKSQATIQQSQMIMETAEVAGDWIAENWMTVLDGTSALIGGGGTVYGAFQALLPKLALPAIPGYGQVACAVLAIWSAYRFISTLM